MAEVMVSLTEGEVVIIKVALGEWISLLKAKGLDGTEAFNDFITLALKMDEASMKLKGG